MPGSQWCQWPVWIALDQETALRRLSSYLMRKGYSSEIVRAAVKDALPQGSGVHFSGVHFD